MKKLQNNFTTPEQSKRLLELGVPADSADCYFINGEVSRPFIRYSPIHLSRLFINNTIAYTPCWSAGRLMEIYDICVINSFGNWADYTTRGDYIKYLISCFEITDFNFSKLED